MPVWATNPYLTSFTQVVRKRSVCNYMRSHNRIGVGKRTLCFMCGA